MQSVSNVSSELLLLNYDLTGASLNFFRFSFHHFSCSHFVPRFQVVTFTAASISYPWDTVRRRLMMQAGRDDVLYRGFLHCTKVLKIDSYFFTSCVLCFTIFFGKVGAETFLEKKTSGGR